VVVTRRFCLHVEQIPDDIAVLNEIIPPLDARVEGRDYLIQDGDIVRYLFNV